MNEMVKIFLGLEADIEQKSNDEIWTMFLHAANLACLIAKGLQLKNSCQLGKVYIDAKERAKGLIYALQDKSIEYLEDENKNKKLDDFIEKFVEDESKISNGENAEDIASMRNFLAECDRFISKYSKKVNAFTTEIKNVECFVAYNQPNQREKTITWFKNELDGQKVKEHVIQTVIAPMQGNDYLFAALELALDEWAKTLPDNPEPQTKE